MKECRAWKRALAANLWHGTSLLYLLQWISTELTPGYSLSQDMISSSRRQSSALNQRGSSSVPSHLLILSTTSGDGTRRSCELRPSLSETTIAHESRERPRLV
ncbi:hypothetical protein C2E23DRAFT_835203 [Lenzites betulinus]|nr:hypothetical protein C2E23DRAFT_835203 [Lenzites betulinus]